MRKEAKVSIAVVKRLPKYYRYLGMMLTKALFSVVLELSEITGLTASQIRQDLNHFGGFGQQGCRYNVEELRGEIEKSSVSTATGDYRWLWKHWASDFQIPWL